jgi:hypothetical protein
MVIRNYVTLNPRYSIALTLSLYFSQEEAIEYKKTVWLHLMQLLIRIFKWDLFDQIIIRHIIFITAIKWYCLYYVLYKMPQQFVFFLDSMEEAAVLLSCWHCWCWVWSLVVTAPFINFALLLNWIFEESR